MSALDSSLWTRTAELRNGARITLRPLRADDREREIVFLNSLSEQTRYLRMMTPLRYLPRHVVDQLMDVDGQRRVAFVATVLEETETFVGVARYGMAEDPLHAEVAVTVRDDWQRTGVAVMLLERLAEYARAAGLHGLIGFVLPENHAMLALARKVGFRTRYAPREHLMFIELDFMSTDARP